MADLLEISAPSMDTLENDGGEEEEGEEDQEDDDDRKREMKGIRRTVLRVNFVCRLFIVDFIYWFCNLILSSPFVQPHSSMILPLPPALHRRTRWRRRKRS